MMSASNGKKTYLCHKVEDVRKAPSSGSLAIKVGVQNGELVDERVVI